MSGYGLEWWRWMSHRFPPIWPALACPQCSWVGGASTPVSWRESLEWVHPQAHSSGQTESQGQPDSSDHDPERFHLLVGRCKMEWMEETEWLWLFLQIIVSPSLLPSPFPLPLPLYLILPPHPPPSRPLPPPSPWVLIGTHPGRTVLDAREAEIKQI